MDLPRVLHPTPLAESGAADTAAIAIRVARADDAPALAGLSGELGYPADARTMRQRLEALEARADHVVFVAEQSGSSIVGWLHLCRAIRLESGESAEILGLVVDQSRRRGGLGRRLVAAAEQWSRSLGLDRIVVRSNAARAESHLFYPALEYVLSKTQRIYLKELSK